MSAVIDARKKDKDLFGSKHGIARLHVASSSRPACQALQGRARGQRLDRGRRYRLSRLLSTSGSRSARRAGWWCRWCATATQMGFAEIEKDIADLGKARARGQADPRRHAGRDFHHLQWRRVRLAAVDPIINPPQSGHARHARIEDRPVAVDGEVVIRPMMYIALSYDHRLIDGRGRGDLLGAHQGMHRRPRTRLLLDL